MYRGCVLTAAARGSSRICGPLLHVLPLSTPFPVNFSVIFIKIKEQKAPQNNSKKVIILIISFHALLDMNFFLKRF